MNLIGIRDIFQKYNSNIERHLYERKELSICMEIFSYLTRKESFKLQYVTYGTLMQITKCQTDQLVDLVKAADYLTTPNAHILDMFFEYYDEAMEDPEPIDNCAVQEALKDGVFYHPISGHTIYNFKNHIYPVFRPSCNLIKFRHNFNMECK